MRTIFSIVLAYFLISFHSAGFAQPARDISQANNRLAFDLYSHLDYNPGNIFFSPYSLSSALTMAYEGARHQTADEMRMVLYLPSDETDWRTDLTDFIQSMNVSNKFYELSTANALWTQKAFVFKDDYLQLVKDTYLGEARDLDFVNSLDPSRLTINAWVSQHTHNRINDLLPVGSIKPDTRLVITDAVYFKGQWKTPFKKMDTKPDTFWLDSVQSVQTDMMTLRAKSFNYINDNGTQVLQLPYRGNDLSMIIFLPLSKNIQDLEKTLTLDMLKQWQGQMSMQPVNVVLPKFKFDSTYEMSGILEAMGMKLAFDEKNADFTGMADRLPGENLYIDKVFHKAWIETNEEGTEAAATTAVVVATAMAVVRMNTPKEFRADHPFIFVIQDNKTGHILFMGRVSDPRQ